MARTWGSEKQEFHDAIEVAKESLEVQACYTYLKNKHVTSWAGFTISVHETRLKAARWLARELGGVERILRSNWTPADPPT
jgi:hypothetical protein